IAVESRDRRAGLLLPAIQRIALLFGLVALAGELLGLLGQPRLFVSRVLKLRVVADYRLFVLMVLRVQRRDGTRRVGDGTFELRGFLREPNEGIAIGRDAVAQHL